MKVTVYDLCVYSRHPPTATIFVSGVGSVELSVTEKVSLSTVSNSSNPGYSVVKETCTFLTGVELLMKSMTNLNLKHVVCPFYSIVSLKNYNCPSGYKSEFGRQEMSEFAGLI